MPTGLSGPATWVNRLLAFSRAVAVPSTAGSAQAGRLNRKIRSVGLADDCGKYFFSSVWPAAESLPAGGVVLPPKPAPL